MEQTDAVVQTTVSILDVISIEKKMIVFSNNVKNYHYYLILRFSGRLVIWGHIVGDLHTGGCTIRERTS